MNKTHKTLTKNINHKIIHDSLEIETRIYFNKLGR